MRCHNNLPVIASLSCQGKGGRHMHCEWELEKATAWSFVQNLKQSSTCWVQNCISYSCQNCLPEPTRVASRGWEQLFWALWSELQHAGITLCYPGRCLQSFSCEGVRIGAGERTLSCYSGETGCRTLQLAKGYISNTGMLCVSLCVYVCGGGSGGKVSACNLRSSWNLIVITHCFTSGCHYPPRDILIVTTKGMILVSDG